jgi:hypothetical protein
MMAFRPAWMALAAALIATPALAGPYDGDWAGVLDAGGRKLRLELHVKTDANGQTAVLESLDQGITAGSAAVKTDGGQLSILFIDPVSGELTGKLSADGKQIVGSWTQGTSLPLTLTKKAKSPEG